MKTRIVITFAVMVMFLVIGLAESEGKTFGQLGGSSRYSTSRGYTGGNQFNRNLIGGRQSSTGRYSRGSNRRFISYSGYRRRSSKGRYRSYSMIIAETAKRMRATAANKSGGVSEKSRFPGNRPIATKKIQR